jgi:putative transposase
VDASSYQGLRCPPEIISHAVWLYHRFPLSFGEVEELLLARAIVVSFRNDSAVVHHVRA